MSRLLLIIYALCLSQIVFAENPKNNEPFNPPLRLINKESMGSLDPGSFKRAEDKKWLSGILQAIITANFDRAMLLDVGFMSRPYPKFRSGTGTNDGYNGFFSLGNGILIFALKGNRIYIYDGDLNLASPRLGMDNQDFLYTLERAKQDPMITDQGDEKFFLKMATFVGTGSIVLYAAQLLTHLPLDFFTVSTAIASLVTFGAAKLSQYEEGKVIVLNRFQRAVGKIIRPPSEGEKPFYRAWDPHVGRAYSDLLGQIIRPFINGRNPTINSCRNLLQR